MFKREKITLGNGLRLLLDQRDSSQSVSICCMVGAGALNDPKGKEGMAHVLEHYLFREQDEEDSNYHFKNIEKYGGSINAFTGIDNTVFEINVHKEDAIQSIDVLAKILCNFKKNADALEIEKEIIIAEMNDVGEDGKNSFQYIKFEMLGVKEGLNHIIGKKSSIRKITLDDLFDFYNNYYCTENMVISIVGCFEKDIIIKQIEDRFSMLKKTPVNPKAHKRDLLKEQGPKLRSYQNPYNGGILLCIPCFSLMTEKLECLELMADIFSDGTHSKLFEHLREKQGLIYSLSNNLTLSHNFGMMDIVISLRPNKLHKILKSLVEISAQLRNEHYSEEFLHQEKMRFIKKRFLMMENNAYAAYWYNERELILDKNFADDLQEWVSRVNNITLEDIKFVRDHLFNSKNWFLICIGNLFFLHKWLLTRKINKML